VISDIDRWPIEEKRSRRIVRPERKKPVTRLYADANVTKAIDLVQWQEDVVSGSYSSNGNARKIYDHGENHYARNQSLVGYRSPRDAAVR